MCTAFSFFKDTLYFGRNMDFPHSFGERVVITPRNYPLSTKRAGVLPSHYAIIGMAHVAGNYPLYAEAANEKGLCAAGLNFPDNAFYRPEEELKEEEGKIFLAPYELIPYLLGKCADLAQARALLERVELAALPYSPALPLAPLHWLVSDASGSLTVEQTREGLKLYENPFGVLTNNPPFPFHAENLRQYLSLAAPPPENRLCPTLSLTPFGEGMGAMGLPGDFSPASRLVKAFFCKQNSLCSPDEDACVQQVFHVLDSVAMVRGSVVTPEGKLDETIYSSCADGAERVYYWRAASASRVSAVRLAEEACRGEELLALAPEEEAAFAFVQPQALV